MTDNWIPVSERLPDGSGAVVLATDGDLVAPAIYELQGEGSWYDGWITYQALDSDHYRFQFWTEFNASHVTHWQLLPRPPEL